MTSRDSLDAVSPLDGRYARYTEPLSPYMSEAALMRARVEVEVEYLIALETLDEIPLTIEDSDLEALRALYADFELTDASVIKQFEIDGYAGYEATNHDVKAVEYFIRNNLPAETEPWVHFALTSEDVNNLAYRLLVRRAFENVLRPAIEEVRAKLQEDAATFHDLPMLARTHGQPATPTTYGKELAVYVSRIDRSLTRIERAGEELAGKVAGASGTYAAHHVAYPTVDWQAFAREFISELGFEPLPATTQVNPGDDIAALFDALRGLHNVLIDLNQDMWLYISNRYLKQDVSKTAAETGSSTMPHKVNPIDFENSEGNLSKANNDLSFLADTITRSRLQRDLSDSTVKRNFGTAFAHSLIGYQKAFAGLKKVVPDTSVLEAELAANPEVIGEAVQTILRREGDPEAYERLKTLTRGSRTDIDDFHALFDDLEIDDAVREELYQLTPDSYTGIAESIVATVLEANK